ncbi:MAG: cation transporting ATPase C-terminal domain-containing protein [Anaerolineales bacterium]|nr:cation transporting ATPase C-terminal domain-containing protein [Anaerolineales bacterium]MCB9128176.1 cation transporting ATPase C-terminal domain-containing protein [Ardenticatenales bacterium]MCB9171885.1 cation transporting ATPase C-terminal domain-containing protein [Ardenticatenales bacterium]
MPPRTKRRISVWQWASPARRSPYWRNDPTGPWQSIVFTTLVLAQLANALATRSSTESLLAIGFFSNRLLLLAIGGGLPFTVTATLSALLPAHLPDPTALCVRLLALLVGR